MSEDSFVIRPIAPEELAEARRDAVDEHSEATVRLVAEGGEPLRCCLRDARPGEALVLFSYAPRLPGSPYQEKGAVLAHADECPGPADLSAYPEDWYGRPQILRAYDGRGWIHEATTMHDGTHPEEAIAGVLARPGVVEVHSRNVLYGCYMFTVTCRGTATQ